MAQPKPRQPKPKKPKSIKQVEAEKAEALRKLELEERFYKPGRQLGEGLQKVESEAAAARAQAAAAQAAGEAAGPPPSPLDMVPVRYGMLLPRAQAAAFKDWQIEMLAFRDADRLPQLKLDKFEHLRRVYQYLYPSLKWNNWLERMTAAFCNQGHVVRTGGAVVRVISLVGVAAAGKTFSVGRYAFTWWLADVHNSIAILTSTTKGAVGQRVWPVIQHSYHEARASIAALHGLKPEAVDLGNLIDSQKILQASKGDNKHAVFAQAVKGGETSKAEAFIQGQHARRMLIAIDECNETPEAILGVVANLKKGCSDLTVIVLGNPMSRLDPHGRCCTPKGGWGQRPLHGNSWPTEGVPEWQIDPGVCLQFKGSESPNVKAGRTVHPHIYSWENYQASLAPGVRNTLRYWRYDAGDWPPEGTCNTVFNETMAVQCGMLERVVFLTTATPVSFLDPGFGGDACVQMVGLLGDVEQAEGSAASPGLQPFAMAAQRGAFPSRTPAPRQALLITHVLELELAEGVKDAQGKPLDIVHQIARQVVANCQWHGVVPANFGLYSTGTGMGIASVLYTDWSDEILKVEEGGLPSELPVSESDRRPAREVYDRRVTELWFSARELAAGGQLRGVDNATLAELCAREYDLTGKPAKYRVETKDEFKPKIGKSPDRGDTLCGLVELVRVRHGVFGSSSGGEGVERAEDKWETQAAAAAQAWQGGYSEVNEREEVEAAESLAGAPQVW